MTKVLTEEQADAIVPRTKRARVSKQERLEERENEALDELYKAGFRVTFHEMPRYVEADELLGIESGLVRGSVFAVMYGRDGKRKHVSGSSAIEALQHARAWWKWQESLKDDAAAKFVPSLDHECVPESLVLHRAVGDTAETKQRRENTERRVVSLQGTAHLVDAHGAPIDAERASQYVNNEQEHTSR